MAAPIVDAQLLAFLQSVAANKSSFQEPGRGYDPDALSPKDSLLLGLPPRPDREDPSFELWHALASARTVQGADPIEPSIAPDPPRTGYNRLGLKGHLETSRNWSGAVISSPYRSRPFDFLIGTWKVPDFQLPAQGTENEYACSTWIGFDGHRRNSKSLPQLGTVQHIDERSAGNYTKSIRAWWQWWHKDDKRGPHEYATSAFPIAVGQKIIASLFVIPKVGVLMNMVNVDTGKPITPVLAPTTPKLEPRTLDAECVLERPKRVADPYTNFVTPAFEPTTFQCFATLRGETRSRDMRGGRLIRMVHSRDRQIETIATPDPFSSRDTVTVQYCLK